MGRLRGYEFCGNYDDHLKLNATRVLYFGIEYAFDSGLLMILDYYRAEWKL